MADLGAADMNTPHKKRRAQKRKAVAASATKAKQDDDNNNNAEEPMEEEEAELNPLEATWNSWFKKMMQEVDVTVPKEAKQPKEQPKQTKEPKQPKEQRKPVVAKRARKKKIVVVEEREDSDDDDEEFELELDEEEVISDEEELDSEEEEELEETLQQLLGRGALMLLANKKISGGDGWKDGLTEEEVTRYEWIFAKLEDMELDVPKILRSNLSDFEKEQAVNAYLSHRPGHPRYDDTARLIIARRETPLAVEQLNHYDTLEKHLSRHSREQFSLKHKILDLRLPEKHLTVVWETYEMLQRLEPGQSDYNKHYEWLQWILRMPWGVYCPMPVFKESSELRQTLSSLRHQLDRNVYGLDAVKEELMLFCMDRLVHRTFASDHKSSQRGGKILTIEGSPGVGKTHLIRTLASSWGLPFQSIAAGGCKDSSFWDGHGITYEGSVPGRVVKAIRASKTMNPVIYIDELDKISDHEHSKDVSGILLHILDETQNSEFYDKYFGEVPLDLSQVLWVLSINDRELINPVLRDRLYILKIPDPSVNDKVETAERIIIPELLTMYGLTQEDITFPKETIRMLIDRKTNKEQGMRMLKQVVEAIIRRVAFLKDTLISLPHAAIWHAAGVAAAAAAQQVMPAPLPGQFTQASAAGALQTSAELFQARKAEKDAFVAQTSFALENFNLPLCVTNRVAEKLLTHFKVEEKSESVRRMYN